jgi:molybdate transport system substrate-binding protein
MLVKRNPGHRSTKNDPLFEAIARQPAQLLTGGSSSSSSWPENEFATDTAAKVRGTESALKDRSDWIVIGGQYELNESEEDMMRTRYTFTVVAATACLLTFVAGTVVHGAEVTVVASAGPLPNVMPAVLQMFERATGNKVTITFKGAPAITTDIKQGAADLVITNADVVDDLVKGGDILAGGRTMVMISKIGVAVRAGAPKPDISTADRFKAALLAAKSVGYSQGTSGQLFLTVIDRLGIADAVKAKAVIAQGEPVGAFIAKGAAEIGVQQVAELLPVAGIDLVGGLPGDLQKQIPYAAGVAAKARERAAASALVTFMRSEPVLAVLKQKGMDLP